MNETADSSSMPPLGGCTAELRRLRRFEGGTDRALWVYSPRDEDGVIRLVQALGARGISFAPLGANLSFDRQGDTQQVAISTEHLNHVHVDQAARSLRAGAGALNGQVLAAALQRGLAPAVLPSSSRISVGGSVSGNSYSRMTPTYGREGASVRSLRLVTASGEQLRCTRNDHPELFAAAIGGFGLIGIITEVEYELLTTGDTPAFCSSVHGYRGVDGLAYLLPENRPEQLPAGDWPGAGCVVLSPGGRPHTMISRHRIEDTRDRQRSVIHSGGLPRLALDLLVRELPGLAAWLWKLSWDPRRPRQLRDDLPSATFFMDGALRGAAVARRLGRPVDVVQQSLLLPIAERSAAEVARVEGFVRQLVERLRREGLHVGMLDVSFIPALDECLLSPLAGQEAFLVSAAFSGRGARPRSRLARLLGELTEQGHADHGAAVYLTKQAFCSNQLLQRMYSAPLAALRQLRQRHDPQGLIDTRLGRRLGLCRPASASLDLGRVSTGC
jgi:hypothetical protein